MSESSRTVTSQDALKQAAAEKALEWIQDDHVIGLGSGSTVRFLLLGLGKRLKEGLHIHGVPTSKDTASLATQLGIPLLSEEEEWNIDISIDGADQVDPQLNLIKGGGGALLREKIVARAARQFIVIVDEGKRTPLLGSSVSVPVEIVPFGWVNTVNMLKRFGTEIMLRQQAGKPFITDNGHFIVDVNIEKISNPRELETQLNQIPGVVENGLFSGLTSILIVATAAGIETKSPTT